MPAANSSSRESDAVPEPIVISFPAPLGTAEVVAPPTSLQAGAPPNGGNASATRASAKAAQAALEEARIRLEEERRLLGEARTTLEKAAAAVRALEAKVLAGAEAQVVELAIEIAGKVLMQELEAGRFQMEPVVREALRHMPARRDIVVRLCPQDAAAWVAAATAAPGAAPGLKVVADPAIRRGDCIVETAEATVSATVTERFQAVAEVLRQANKS
jgi:flagellar biosynthesis/type III secretory pathway protein FliH